MDHDHKVVEAEITIVTHGFRQDNEVVLKIEEGSPAPMDTEQSPRGWRFWAIFPALWLAAFLTALDATVLANSLPTITQDLGASSAYIWAINSYVLALTAVQPLIGQFANLYGRKSTLIATFLIFMLGSGLCGGARTFTIFLAGRTIQGLGGAGLNILPALVVADLVPLKERQLYQSLIYLAFAIGTFVGPIVGGALAVSWHWIFYLNLPLSALGILTTLVFLRVHSGKPEKAFAKLCRLDYVGNTILITGMTAILIALSDAAAVEGRWSSWKILVPLCLGLFALLLFVLWEKSGWCKEPTTPLRLFTNRTSAVAFSLTFIHGMGMYWAAYFLPVYFQSVLLATPLRSGVNTLPGVLVLVPAGIIGAAMISKLGRYRENHVIGFGLMTIGAGCFSTLDENTRTAVWVVLSMICSTGAGFILTATLTAIQAPLQESDVAAAMAAWGYIQSLGFICGAAVPSNIFTTRFQQLENRIQDQAVRDQLANGAAYEHATRSFLLSLNPETRQQVIQTFVPTLQLLWLVLVAFTGLGCLLSLLLRNVVLRTSLETEYGYKEKQGGRPDGDNGIKSSENR